MYLMDGYYLKNVPKSECIYMQQIYAWLTMVLFYLVSCAVKILLLFRAECNLLQARVHTHTHTCTHTHTTYSFMHMHTCVCMHMHTIHSKWDASPCRKKASTYLQVLLLFPSENLSHLILLQVKYWAGEVTWLVLVLV